MDFKAGKYKVHEGRSGQFEASPEGYGAWGTVVEVTAHGRAFWSDEDGMHVYEARRGKAAMVASRVPTSKPTTLPRGMAEGVAAMAKAALLAAERAAKEAAADAEKPDGDAETVLSTLGRKRMGPSAEVVDAAEQPARILASRNYPGRAA